MELNCKNCIHNKEDLRYTASEEYRYYCDLKKISKNSLRGCIKWKENKVK